jgi:hypothetical protein
MKATTLWDVATYSLEDVDRSFRISILIYIYIYTLYFTFIISLFCFIHFYVFEFWINTFSVGKVPNFVTNPNLKVLIL